MWGVGYGPGGEVVARKSYIPGEEAMVCVHPYFRAVEICHISVSLFGEQ